MLFSLIDNNFGKPHDRTNRQKRFDLSDKTG
jgi:hypothetical protein